MKTLLMSTGTAAATYGSAADAGLSDAARALSSSVVDNALQYGFAVASEPENEPSAC